VYLLTRDFCNRTAALWAAAITGASAAHLLGSAQIRVDLTMVGLVTLAAWLGLRAMMMRDARWILASGVMCGLAVMAKYPALLVVTPILLVVLHSQRYAPRAVVATLSGFMTGILGGAPYLLARWPEVYRQISDAAAVGQPIPPRLALSPAALLWQHADNIVRFGLGPVAALLAIAGTVMVMRRKSIEAALIIAALAGSVLTFIPLKWPLLRYDLLVLPWLALAAGVALARLSPRLRLPLGCAAVLFPLGASVAQIHYMRSPHPANKALDLILREVPPGTAIARIAAELPPLNRKVYPMGSNPFMDDLRVNSPEWVLTADLPDTEYPPENQQLLATEYDVAGVFRSQRILGWATIGESGAPHDWRYTHPEMTLYRRRP
jgi:4-amino-4-deoxy-L-arabinose transferase-like glycosyltransferase